MKTTFKTAILALALAVTVSASAEGYQFTKNLKKGMKGADVTALQTALGISPATGYFGNMTLAAVKTYQTANMIPSTGFVGPMTRAKMNMTGGTPTIPGTTPTTPVVLNGQEGFAEYKLSPQPVNNTNVQISNDVAVYGVEVKAKNADVSFERLTLDVKLATDSGYTATENPATLINSISIKDGSTVLATIPVNSSTFSKYSGTTNYYVQISGLSTRVAKDTIKTFTVHFNTNSIDTSRYVKIDVAANGARVVDGRGISTYNGALIGARDHVFKKPGNSSVLLKSDATTVYSMNYRVNPLTDGAVKVLTSTFAVKSEQGPSKITAVTVTAATSTGGTMPSNLYLYQGSTLLDSRTVPPTTGVVSFDIENSKVMVNQDQTVSFTVKADMSALTVQQSQVTTTVNSVTYEKADGATATASTTVSGPAHFFATVVPMFTKTSSTVSVTNNQNGIGVSATADVRLNLTASGADILVASTTAVIGLKNASTNALVATTSVQVTPNESGLTYFADGATKAVTLSATFASTSITSTTNLKAYVLSVRYATSTGSTWFTLPGGFEPFDSDNSAVFNK